MTREGQLLRLDDGRPDRRNEPGLAELLDPAALEARLQEARARRSAALAKRSAAAAPEAPPVPEPPAPAAAPSPPRRRLPGIVPGLLFALGLAVGGVGAAVVIQPDLRRGIALLIAPEIASEIAPPAPAAPAPEPEPVPQPPEAAATAPAAPALALAPLPQPGAGAGAAVRPQAAIEPPSPPSAPATDGPPPAVSTALAWPPEAVVTAPAAPTLALAPLPQPGAGAAAGGAVRPQAAAEPPSLPLTPAADTPPPAPVAADLQPAALPPTALPARVFIHFPASAGGEAQAARGALLGLGVPDVEVVPVRFAIGSSNVRYYHAEDRDGAGRVAEAVAASLAGGRPDTRDFTDYRPPPLVGRVEIWLAGTPGAGEERAAAAPGPAQPEPLPVPAPEPLPPVVAAPATPVAPGSQAEAVARIIVQRSLERLLEQAPAR